MSDYKRKKHKHSPAKKQKPKKNKVVFDEEEIEADIEKKSALKVVKGKRLMRRRRLKILLAVAVVISLTLIILSIALPVNLSENVNNLFAVMGSGSYPVDLSGSEVLSAEGKSNFYYVLTDTNLMAISDSGKVIYNNHHGFSKPVLKTSPTRAMIFDQGGSTLNIYNLSKQTNSYTTDNRILTAAVARNGQYAVATTSSDYTSSVEVYDRGDNLLYKWNCAKDMINNVAIASSGKQIAVSTVNAVNGKLVSHVYVLGFDSADSKYHFEITDGSVMSLDDFGKGFTVVSNKGYSYIDWSKYNKTDYNSEFELDKFRKGGSGAALVFNRSSDRSDNTIVAFNSKGEKQGEFAFNGIISDIRYDHSYIYCINESKVYVYQPNGTKISTYDCGYGGVRIVAVSSDNVVVVSDDCASLIEVNS